MGRTPKFERGCLLRLEARKGSILPVWGSWVKGYILSWAGFGNLDNIPGLELKKRGAPTTFSKNYRERGHSHSLALEKGVCSPE